MHEEIGELLAKAARTRYQLLKTELQSFIIAAEMAQFELSIGNREVAVSEVAAAENGACVVERFAERLPEGQRTEVEAKLADLRAMLEQVKAGLKASAAG